MTNASFLKTRSSKAMFPFWRAIGQENGCNASKKQPAVEKQPEQTSRALGEGKLQSELQSWCRPDLGGGPGDGPTGWKSAVQGERTNGST